MDKPLVSIIVPLYNKAPYIEQCLRTLCDQTLENIEVIIVDDGSTDGGETIAKTLCAGDERFIYLRQENAGVSSALNTGLAQAKGRFIGRVDADDWIEPDMYQRLIQAADEFGVTHARCGAIREHADGHRRQIPCCATTETRGGQWCFEKLFGEVFIPFMSTYLGIYDRETILRADLRYPPSLRNLEDIYFNARFFALDLPVALIPDTLYHYREDPMSLSQKPSVRLPEQLGTFEQLMQETVLVDNPHLLPHYAHYRAIAMLTTAADMSAHGVAGMKALTDNAMYLALGGEDDRSRYPQSLRILMRLLDARHYSLASLYARGLRLARSVRRRIR